MLFTLELSQLPFGSYRRQQDDSWRDISESAAVLDPADYTTPDAWKITQASSGESTVEIGGRVYDVDPKTIVYGEGREHLSSGSRVFRDSLPPTPDRAQLTDVIRRGDDTVNNSLVLNVDGVFEVRPVPPYNFFVNDPTVVLRHETFCRGNGYVGTANAIEPAWLDRIYADSLAYWLRHLESHRTQMYSDYFENQDVKRLLDEIEDFASKWSPDY